MAHEVETLAYVGEVPWHGLGQYLGDEDVAGERMLDAAGLNWTVAKRKLRSVLPDGSLIDVPGFYAVVREDRQEALGVVGADWQPAQNRDAFAVPRVLVDEGAIRYHTAASLRGGRTVFVLARLSDVAVKRLGEKSPSDVIHRFLLFSNSHTGKRSALVGLTPVRVVCQNTLSAAVSGMKSAIKVRHVGDVEARIVEAHRVLLGIEQAYADWTAHAQALADARFDKRQMRRFAGELLNETRGQHGEDVPDDVRKARESHENRAKAIDELVALFETGIGNTGESKWDAFNAVTEYLDHAKRRLATYKATAARAERHCESELFGKIRRTKTRALRLLTR